MASLACGRLFGFVCKGGQLLSAACGIQIRHWLNGGEGVVGGVAHGCVSGGEYSVPGILFPVFSHGDWCSGGLCVCVL